MKRILLLILALIIAVPVILIGKQFFDEDSGPPPAPSTLTSAQQIERGSYLARAGDCMACHTARGGKEYAGGRAIPTPFGTMYAPNITSDPEHGLGNWSANDFWRALHNGKSKDGRFLYPAFPYPNYTKVTREDSDALFAYMKTIPPVNQVSAEHALRFPYNYRVLLAGWRALYFTPGVYRPEGTQSVEWNRGAYLVQGLGHCSACHTTRNAFGATVDKSDLAGGLIPIMNWYAPSLTSDAEAGLGNWEIDHITALLKTGVSERSTVFGPMAEVVSQSLQHLTDNDVKSMAVYLKSLQDFGTQVFAALLPQSFQTTHTAFVTGTTRLHTLADPDFFLRQEFIELGVLDFFIGQQIGLACLICGEVAGERQQLAAIQFDDAGGHVIQETAIMGDEQYAALVVAQQTFEPQDGTEIQVVGRFIEQQHIRTANQTAGQRHALLHAARQFADQRMAIQVQLVQRDLDLVIQTPGIGRIKLDLNVMHALHDGVIIVAAELAGQRFIFVQQGRQLAQAGSDGIKHGHLGREMRFLINVSDLQILLHHQQTIIQLRYACDDFQQRRFTGAVTADQTNPLPCLQRKLSMIEKGNVAECKLRIGERDDCHRSDFDARTA
jgi:mono/diheme cytochrome c family protein